MRTLDRWHVYAGFASLVLAAATAVAGPIALLTGSFLCLIALVSTVSIQRSCTISIAAAFLFLVAVPTYGASLPLKAASLAVSILVLSIAAIRSQLNVSSIASKSLLGATAFLLYGAILAAMRGDPGAAALSGFTAIIGALGVSLYIYLDDAHRGFLTTMVIAIMVLQVAHAFAEVYLGLTSYFGYMGAASMASERTNELLSLIPGRAVGTFGHPILLGLYCAFATIVVQSNKIPPSLRILASTTGVIGIFLAGSRSALIGLILGLAALYFSSKIRHSRSFTVLLVAGTVSVVMVRFGQSISDYITEVGATMSFTHRFSVLGTWRLLFERPISEVAFGGGPEAMRTLLASEVVGKGGFLATDNQFLLTLATLGLIGLVAQVYVSTTSLIKGSPQSRAVMVLSLFMMFSFDSLTWAVPAVIFMLGAIGLYKKVDKEKEVAPLGLNMYPLPRASRALSHDPKDTP